VFLLAFFFDESAIRRYYRAPMSAGLPQHIDVRRFAETGRHLEGEIGLVDCERLSQAVSPDSGPFSVQLDFEKQPDGKVTISGEISGQVKMSCQRCLELVNIDLDCEVLLAVVGSEDESEYLPAELDPLIVDDDVNLTEMIEDELLLALPLVPLHDDCEPPASVLSAQGGDTELVERDNPFAVLASLKKDS
jgi:uncharacterized protein